MGASVSCASGRLSMVDMTCCASGLNAKLRRKRGGVYSPESPASPASPFSPASFSSGSLSPSMKRAQGRSPSRLTLGSQTRQRLTRALDESFVFSSLPAEHRQALLQCMFEHSVDQGEEVIREGEDGDHFYLVDSGELEVRVSEDDGATRAVFALTSGSCLGELATLYACPRTCSVVAKTASVLWALDTEVFRTFAMDAVRAKRERYDDLLQQVPLFRELESYERAFIIDSLQTADFGAGEIIVTEGDAGDRFYLLELGEAVASKQQRTGAPLEVSRYGPASFFGELGLLLDQPRQATVTAVRRCRTAFIDRSRFSQLLAGGKLKALMLAQAREYLRVNEENTAREREKEGRKREKKERRRAAKDRESRHRDKRKDRGRDGDQDHRGGSSRSSSRRETSRPLPSRSSKSHSSHSGRAFDKRKRVGPRGETRRLRISNALCECAAFNGLRQDEVLSIVDKTYELLLPPGHDVMTQGAPGHEMYVLEAGELDVFEEDKETGERRAVNRLKSGAVVGEVALIDPGSAREATVRATANGARLWTLAHKDFFEIAGAHITAKRVVYVNFLSKVPMFDGIDECAMKQMADAMTPAYYADGEAIVRQGEAGEAFFVLEHGQAVATVLPPGQDAAVEVMRYDKKGEFFGELALLTDTTRKASVHAVGPAKFARMDRAAFKRLTARIASLREMLEGAQANYA